MDHESDGVEVSSPVLMILRGRLQLNAAEYQIWSLPLECSPSQVPDLLLESYRALASLAAIVTLVGGTDVDGQRRAELEAIGGLLAQALTGLLALSRAAA